MALIFTTILL